MQDRQVRPAGTKALEDGIGDLMVAAQADQRMSQPQRAPDSGFNRGKSGYGAFRQVEIAGIVDCAGAAKVDAVFCPQIAGVRVQRFANQVRGMRRSAQEAGVGVKGNAEEGDGLVDWVGLGTC